MIPVSLDSDLAATEAARAAVAFRETKFFGSLDGLRALSVLAVVWYHTAAPAYPDIWLLQAGNYGVALFFAISGFLITTLLLRERERTRKIDLRAFYARRSLRIFPLYYAVLALYAALVFVFEKDSEAGEGFWTNLLFFATYTSNLFIENDGRVIFYFAWSLAAEEQFYLVWPVLMARLGHAALLAVLAVLVLVAGLHQDYVTEGMFGAGYEFIAGHLATPLFLGALGAYALHSPKTFGGVYRALGPAWVAPAIGFTALAALASEDAPVTLVHVLFVLLVMATVIRPDHGLSRLLDQPVLRKIGVASYGIYLLHMLCANAVRRASGSYDIEDGPLLFVLTSALAIFVALLSRKYFEAYFLRLKASFAR